jgi:hypothetical protein
MPGTVRVSTRRASEAVEVGAAKIEWGGPARPGRAASVARTAVALTSFRLS